MTEPRGRWPDPVLHVGPLLSASFVLLLAGAFLQFSRLAPDAGFWPVMTAGGAVGVLSLYLPLVFAVPAWFERRRM